MSLYPSALFAQGSNSVQGAAQRLAERIAAIPGVHGPFRLDWHTDGHWTDGESHLWQQALRDEFEKRSVAFTEDVSAPLLELFAEVTPAQVILTARIRGSDHDDVRIVSIPRAQLPPPEMPVAPVRLERLLLYESPDRILDASSPSNASEDGVAVVVYRNFELLALRIDSTGDLKQIVPLSAAGMKPSRDPRAELNPTDRGTALQLIGKTCEISWQPSEEVKCRTAKPPAPGRSVWREPVVLFSPCDENNWIVSGSGTEPSAKDILQVVPDGTLRESSAAVLSEFPGPILSINAEHDPASALVVARNLRTGNYEVYKISLACGN